MTVFEISVKIITSNFSRVPKKLNKCAERFPLITAWHLIRELADLEINRVGACELTFNSRVKLI